MHLIISIYFLHFYILMNMNAKFRYYINVTLFYLIETHIKSLILLNSE